MDENEYRSKIVKRQGLEKHYSEATRKLHIPCPYPEETGVRVHVVIRNGCCYRSEQCTMLKCKFNRVQSDLKCLISLVW